MIQRLLLGSLAVLLTGAERHAVPALLAFQLRESSAGIEKQLGAPTHTTGQRGYRLLEYTFGEADHDDLGFEWAFYFEHPSGDLLSVTRNYGPPANVAAFFPGVARQVVDGSSKLPFLVRELPGGRVLLGVGIARANEPCSQLVLMRASAVQRFFPGLPLH